MKTFNFSIFNKGVAVFCGVCLLSGIAMATSIKDYSEHPVGDRSINSVRAISERIAQVGQVCLEGEECKQEVPAQAKVDTGSHTETEPKGPRSGEQVVQSACFGCHGTGAAGAPVMGKPVWQELAAAKGVDGLLKSALSGKGAMPPKGMCMDCSDDEIKAAIEYMIAQ